MRFRSLTVLLMSFMALTVLTRCQERGLGVPTGTLATPAPTAGQTSPSPAATPIAIFEVSPPPEPDGIVRDESSTGVTFNMCRTTNPDPTRVELYFAIDFVGDGSASHAGTSGADCRATYFYPAGHAAPTICVVDRDRETHVALHAQQCATYHVMTDFCHSINGGGFGACPTGVVRFCDTRPILSTSHDQAMLACETCFGAGTCGTTGTSPAVTHFAYSAPFITEADYGYSFDRAGKIFGASAFDDGLHLTGRWAP